MSTPKVSQDAAEVDTVVEIHEKFAHKTLQDYEVLSVIGNGSFGTCYKVRDKQTGELYAWKGMDYDELSEAQKQSLVCEINVLRQLQHPNIVQYYHHLVNHEAKSVFIVMECCDGGDLAQLIAKARQQRKRFEEKYIWRVLFQLCKALQVCHNRIKRGTILHRDIKPANIFLDAEGNAKLGDFGLARMLQRNESFAHSFVGTPYYMSPELVKGVRYDRKSDVWAVGCLVYELCALRPPFKGQQFEQLSANISMGKFNNLPAVYSNDLQEIIAYMLAVENEQRPSIEIISRHPLLVRNIVELGNEFPELVPAEEDFFGNMNAGSKHCKLEYSAMHDSTSTTFTEEHSFCENNSPRRLSVSRVFTPELRAELFYSAKRRIFTKPKPSFMQSDPQLYESICYEMQEKNTQNVTKQTTSTQLMIKQINKQESPTLISKSIFDKALQDRLHAIRAHECLLIEREASLDDRACELNEKEKHLQQLERTLQERAKALDLRDQNTLQHKCSTKPLQQTQAPILPARTNSQTIAISLPPPVPPRRSAKATHDDTYCSIESNDSPSQQRTVAKINMANLPAAAARTFPSLRKVTFQSPKKIVAYDIENMAPKIEKTISVCGQMRNSVSSKGSEDSSESVTRRKSILSIFGLYRNNKENATSKGHTAGSQVGPSNKEIDSLLKTKDKDKETHVLSKCKANELNQIWTKENKRAAFELLAAMNAAESTGSNGRSTTLTHNKHRQSVRERSSVLQRNRQRRSLLVRDQILI